MHDSMINGHFGCAASEDKGQLDLVKFSNFLCEKAEIIIAAGVIRLRMSESNSKINTQ